MNNRDILGVGQNASHSEIKQAFRNAAKELHPDHSDSPEAAEAFTRIKEAHDALLKEADVPRESVSATASAARASAATTQAAFSTNHQDDDVDTAEIARIQELDNLAKQSSRSLFRRTKESEEVRRHRKKLKTNERRLRGLY